MLVTHIIREFSPLSETFIYDSVIETTMQGVGARVITARRTNVAERPFAQATEISYLSRWHPERLWSRLSVLLRMRAPDEQYLPILRHGYAHAIHSVPPDIIHAHYGDVGYQVAPVARHYNIPLVVSFHGYDAFMLPKQSQWQARYRTLFDVMSTAIVVSETMRQHLINLGVNPSKIQVVHVGKRLDDFPFKAVTSPLKAWLSIGRLVEKKGFEDAITAFAKALPNLPSDAHLTIIGEGPLRSELETQVVSLGVDNRIHLVGPKPHHEVREFLLQSDAFILCSKTAASGDSEGIPTVLMEAQASGLPCISTKHSGIPEVFPTENQRWLAPEGAVDEIARLIEELSASSLEALQNIARNARTKIEQDFNLVTETQKLRSIYQSLGKATVR